MRTSSIGLTFALVLTLAGCAHVPPTATSSVSELTALDSRLQKAVEVRDLDLIVSFYAEDAVLLPAAEPTVIGREAIRSEWKHILAIPDFTNSSSLSKVEVSNSGDMAYSMGTYRSTMMGEDGKPTVEPGKWLSVWKRQEDGSWRIVVDTYNTDVPPPAHK